VSAPRAAWKGFLKFGSVACGVKVVGAETHAEKIRFRTLNRKTRNTVSAVYVDEVTGDVVETADQIKGYELDKGDFLTLEPDEIKALKLTSDHTLDVEGFVPVAEIDQRYLDKPYYLIPADVAATESYCVIREALKQREVAARSCIVLYQRGREVVIQPHGKGLLMTTLRPKAEMIAAASVFDELKSVKADPEMVEIAELIIAKKKGKYDPAKFVDTYEDALAELIAAKKAGRALPKAAPAPKENVVNLAEVLKKSLEKEGIAAPKAKRRGKAA
jgi:DNA end-binding protein Ku